MCIGDKFTAGIVFPGRVAYPADNVCYNRRRIVVVVRHDCVLDIFNKHDTERSLHGVNLPHSIDPDLPPDSDERAEPLHLILRVLSMT